jgi:nascent polypeptide-associated complex subunit alpha
MIPGGRISERQMKRMMKRMGIVTEEIGDVTEVIIKTTTKEYVFKDAVVTAVEIQGQKTYQIIGEPEVFEVGKGEILKISEEDIALVVEQTGASEEDAKKALAECDGKPAEAILKLLGER